jgi:hypothetical protein
LETKFVFNDDEISFFSEVRRSLGLSFLWLHTLDSFDYILRQAVLHGKSDFSMLRIANLYGEKGCGKIGEEPSPWRRA